MKIDMSEAYSYRVRYHFMRYLMCYARTIPFIPTKSEILKFVESVPNLKDNERYVVIQFIDGHGWEYISNLPTGKVTKCRATQIFNKAIRKMRGPHSSGLLRLGLTPEQIAQYNKEWDDYLGVI